ncbi:MAG: riboflavin synthase subunit alpha [Betaproteobacteria bacterium]
MFTGIVQGVATVVATADRPGLRTLRLAFPPGFLAGIEIGASVAVDGVCLTVTGYGPAGTTVAAGAAASGSPWADFDVMHQTLSLTTLGGLTEGSRVNVERAAREGAEVGGHVLSGHVDCCATVQQIRTPDNNCVLRFAVPAPWMRYVFAKGYIAVNGASLTVAEAGRQADGSGWFEVWLIPETLRMTTFANKAEGDAVHIEIERTTQVMVDTVRQAVDERLGPLMPVLQAWARSQGLDLQALAEGAVVDRKA